MNLAAYHDAWSKVSAATGQGGRLVLGRVTSDLREFHPDLDVELPATSVLFDNALDREGRAKAFKAQVGEALTKALEVPCSQRTAILDTLDVAAKFLAVDSRRHRRLVLLSDMLEDSSSARFEHGPGPARWNQLLTKRRKEGALPNLNGVDVHVVGAAASSSELMREVQRFWSAYLNATGATLKPEHYGPVFFGF